MTRSKLVRFCFVIYFNKSQIMHKVILLYLWLSLAACVCCRSTWARVTAARRVARRSRTRRASCATSALSTPTWRRAPSGRRRAASCSAAASSSRASPSGSGRRTPRRWGAPRCRPRYDDRSSERSTSWSVRTMTTARTWPRPTPTLTTLAWI